MRFLALLSLLCTLFAVVPVSEASDFSLYSKTGYMNWKEVENGRQFIREKGPTEEIGVSYMTKMYFLDLNAKVGVWGSVFGYDGSSAETANPEKMTTGDFGGKGALMLALPIPISGKVEIAPVIGTGVDYFWRSVGPEKWLVFSSKAGARVKVGPVELLGGVMLPYKTTDSIDWTAIGASSKVSVSPKGMMTPFVEAKAKTGRWEISLFYEPMRWGASDKAPFAYSGQNTTAAIATVTGIYQPETIVQHMGISFGYHF